MNTLRKIFRNIELVSLVLFLCLATLIGSGCPGSDNKDDTSSADVDNGADDEAVFIASSFVTVEDGGLVYLTSTDHELNGASIDVPPHTVDQKTEISFGIRNQCLQVLHMARFLLENFLHWNLRGSNSMRM